MLKRFLVLFCLLMPALALTAAPLKLYSYRDKGYSVGVLEGGRGPHVLLVHGLGVSRASMQKLAGVMASSGYHVILPDIPGQGTTERDKRRKYSVDAQARFLKRLLDHKRTDRAFVIGNSMGGHIAVSLALLHPQKVKKLVLISPAGLQNGGPLPYLKLEIPEDVEEKKKRDLEWKNYVRRDIHAGMHYPIDPYLEGIQIPTLIVWGEKDEILPVDLAPVWHRRIRASRLIRLENRGHMPQDEDPEFFLEQIRSYGEGEYFFVTDLNGVILSHPDKSLRNRNLTDMKDATGKAFIQEMVDGAKKTVAASSIMCGQSRAAQNRLVKSRPIASYPNGAGLWPPASGSMMSTDLHHSLRGVYGYLRQSVWLVWRFLFSSLRL